MNPLQTARHVLPASKATKLFCTATPVDTSSKKPKPMKYKKLPTLFAVLMLANAISHAQISYTTTWVGNTFGDNAHHVGNVARAIWVATNGVVYTASLWDENASGIGIYQNGQNLGSIGAHGEVQGCSITGDSVAVFAEEQGVNGGKVGRYNRSTHVRELMFTVSATNGDSVPGLAISPFNGLLYASDKNGNRIRVFTTNGVWQQDWTVSNPGAMAVDNSGNVWVAQKTNATIQEFNATGGALKTITMGASSRPSALYFDTPNAQLMVGDEGPDQNIKIYGNLGGTPTLAGTFGVTGGYLSAAGGVIKGTVGDKRFTRVVGIGKDNAGNLYVSHNCWGGTWDLGRDGATDLHCYNSAGTLQWTLQALNFEGEGVVDTATEGTTLYNGKVIMTGSGGAGYVANTVDPFTYPSDGRLNIADPSRGFDFAMLATVGTNRILMAAGQNPDKFYSYYFNAANGYIAIPGVVWGLSHERNGFCLDSAGNVWEGRDKTSAIWFNQLTGFDTNGAPIYAPVTSTPTPASISPLGRIIYMPANDTMILGQAITNDWSSLGTRVEVYQGWRAGNTNAPNTVITLTNVNPKTMAAAGNYLFVGYVHTVPNIDAYNLTTGTLDLTMTNASPSTVYVGNDIDSMYGLSAYQKSNGQYIVTKDNYNGASVVIHTMTATAPQVAAPSFSPAAGLYTSAQSVTISTITSGASIRYTTDGSTPTSTTGTLYSGPVTISAGTTTLKAIAYKSGFTDSAITSGTYTIWLTQDIGAVGIAGSAVYSNGTFTVVGSGTDISRNADQFRYVCQTGGTGCTITARVASMTNPNSAAKAGVMCRETLATNSTEASITVTPANGVTWQYRATTGDTTGGSRTSGLVAPYWVRLVRSGSTFTGYLSADGLAWTQQGTTNITMASSINIGLCVTSRDNTQVCTATFDNVTVTP